MLRGSEKAVIQEKGREFKQSRADSVQNLDRDDALSIGSGINELDSMLPCAEMHRCVLMEGVKMTLQEGRLYGNLTVRACDDLACSEKQCNDYG